jgi:hypothetical protein
MKTNKITRILIALIILFIAGCGYKYEVKTVINADGSCIRTLIVTYEDTIDKFYEGDYPIPIDTTWSLVIEQDTNDNGDTVFIHITSKYFETVEELNQLFPKDSTEHRFLDRSISLNKRFRWFYTFLDYKETYQKLFDQPSLLTYIDSTYYNYVMLNDEEQKKYLEEKFDTIHAKKFDEEAEIGFNKWIEFSIINSCLEAIEESAKNIEDWQLDEVEFSSKRDSIINQIGGELELFEDDDNVFAAVKRIFNIDSTRFEELENEKHFKKFSDNYLLWDHILLDEDYINTVQMPGLIIETNSTSISDSNEVAWNVGWMKYFTDDYEMKVTSRIVNVWTFWVSSGFILLLFLLIMLRRIYKSKN